MMGTLLLTIFTLLTPFIVTSIGTRDPYRLWIGEETTYPLRVWNRGPLHAVERIGQRDVRIHGAHRIALITPEHTEFRLAMTVSGSDANDGFRLRFRTTERDYTDLGRGGIALTLNRSGLIITDDDRLLATTDTIRYHAGVPYRIAVEHDGQQVRIAVGCSLFGPYRTDLPATQYTLVESLGSSDAELVLSDIAAAGSRD